MIFISPNIGHAVFAPFLMFVAAVTIAEITVKKPPHWLRYAWGMVMLVVGVATIPILLISNKDPIKNITNLDLGYVQHGIFALTIIVTSLLILFLASLKTDRSAYGKMLQSLAVGVAFLLHTHPGGGHMLWMDLYHHSLSALFFLAVMVWLTVEFTKNRKILWGIPIIMTIIGLMLVLYVEPAGHSHAAAPAASSTAAECNTTGKMHMVNVSQAGFSVPNLTVKQCDQLMIMNTGKLQHDFAVGEHTSHGNYPGLSDKVIKPGESLTVTLTQAGEFLVHDHYHHDLQMNLLITAI